MNRKGFIISTTLYSAFGIMMITVASILFVLSTKTATMTTMTDKLKICIEECDTPENICEGVGDGPIVYDDPCHPELGYENTLACKILGPGYINVWENGLMQEDTNKGSGRTYYYSGNVNNNYIKINDILFRIVRVTEDFKIRLITESATVTGNLDNGMYIDKEGNASDLKQKIDKWGEENFSELPYNRVPNTSLYCAPTMYGLNYNSIYENAPSGKNAPYDYDVLNIDDKDQSFECTYYSLLFYSKYGLLTDDEVKYAGANGNTNNPSYLKSGGTFDTLSIYGYSYVESVNFSDSEYDNVNYGINYYNSYYDSNTNSVLGRDSRKHVNIGNNYTPNPTYKTVSVTTRPVTDINCGWTVTGAGTKDEPYELDFSKNLIYDMEFY